MEQHVLTSTGRHQVPSLVFGIHTLVEFSNWAFSRNRIIFTFHSQPEYERSLNFRIQDTGCRIQLLSNSMTRWLSDSVTQRLSDTVSQWISKSGTQWLRDLVNQWIRDSVTQWLSDSVTQYKLQLCLDIIIVPLVIIFFLTICHYQVNRNIFFYLSFNWNCTKFLKLFNVNDCLWCNTWNIYIHW